MTKKTLARALRAIERKDQICFDVAFSHGQIFENVRRMRWFIEAIADELEPRGAEVKPC